MKTRTFMQFGALPLAGLALLVLTAATVRSAQNRGKDSAPVKSGAQVQSKVLAEGRVVAYPGAEVSVGSEIAGIVASIRVAEKQSVRKGDVLVDLKSDDARAELGEARARLREADADLRLGATEVERSRKLWKEDVGSKQAYDRTLRDRDAAAARVDTARASVRRLEAELAKYRVVAPIDGVITERLVDPGESVSSGEAVVTIADLAHLRVEAEVDEFDLARVKVGKSASVSADGFPGQKWTAGVEEIPDTIVQRRIKPEDPGRLSDTRVLLVKLALPENTPLRLGQRVEVEINLE